MSRRAATRGRRPAARAKAGAVKPSSVRSQRGRPSANHVNLRRDAFERQADAFAAQVAAGERAVGTHNLLRAAPGGFEVAGSPGRPLPVRLRDELEPALGADLRAVRVHTDQPAARAVDDAGALALAAGADVFFGSGRYDPASPTGRDLLVHELAHVLQQTAVAGSAQALRVRDVQGDAPAQAATGRTALNIPPEPAPAPEEIIGRHLAENPKHKGLATAISGVRAELNASPGGSDAWWTKLEGDVLAASDTAAANTADRVVLALHVDLLKARGRFETVAQAVNGVPELMTCFYDERAYTSWPETAGYGWLYSDWGKLSLFAHLGPAQFVGTYTTFLTGVTRSIQTLDGNESLEIWHKNQLAALTKPGKLIPNERTFVLMSCVRRLDDLRLTSLKDRVKHMGVRPERLRPDARQLIATELVIYNEEVGRGQHLEEFPPSSRPSRRDLLSTSPRPPARRCASGIRRSCSTRW